MTSQPFDHELSDESVLALYPPHLPDSNKSVAGADCGIAIAFYDLTPNGATVIVDAYLGQAPLDTIQLNLNGIDNIASTQTQSTDDSVVLYIPKNALRSDPGYLNELTYTVIRGSNNEGTSQPLTIVYNAIRPGMEDKIGGDEGHSELELVLPQDVIDDGIDADRAAQKVQVYVSYPYCRAYDRILLNCNGHDVLREVHPDEAPAAPTSVPTRLGLLLDKAVFDAAGDHPQFSFSFTVTDQIGNGADLNSPWSAPIRVVVDLKGTRMAAPDIAEDPDDPYDAPDTIDLNKLGSKDLTVQVHVLESRWAINDTVRVTYRATPGTGAVVEHIVEEPVGRLPFVHKLMIPNAKVIADSAVAVTYEQVRGGSVFATSKVARARVIVKPVITSLKNSFGVELKNGGTVSDNKVGLSGSALAGVVLQIFNGTVFVEEVRAGSNYKWQSKLIPISVGQHSFTIKEKTGDQIESDPWRIERLVFSIVRTQMKLDGFSVKVPQWPTTGEDSVSNTAIRVPTGGLPPYDYASSDPLTASVSSAGKVTGLKQGVATIYVTDQEGTTLNYLVAVTNVYRLHISTEKLYAYDAIAWMNALGGQPVYNYAFIRDVRRVYFAVFPETINTCHASGRYYTYMRPDLTLYGIEGAQYLNAWCLTAL
ncbi:Ig-like domain-containing protein [Pseudomonas sp. SWRI99]|uniref:Ig-like domain-containing protein n=1 Tax=Pseudomonas sp. SWRI99 TaxID=2745506 RepID=UPI0016493E42|nr:Ig-like domain-containing protein [Pseudomonas sp. SWRI99]MBC3775455.1 Ig-like domain-containing protein [Pseudomonas sp. SWRI99]